MMKKSTFLKISGSILLLNLPLVSYADHCPARIINNLSTPWTVSFDTSQGDVHFSKDSGCPENGPCTINPGQTVDIDYTTSGGHISGEVDATNNDGAGGAAINYDNSGGIILDKCPSSTSGYTDYADFHGGDITIQ